MGNNKIRLEVSKKIEELYFYSNKLIREKGGKIYTGKSELVKVFSDYERFDVILCEIKTEFLTLPSLDLPNDIPSAKHRRSEERRVGKECRSRWSPYH